MAVSGKLSALAVAKLGKPGRYADGANLYLQVTATGTKSWILRFMRNGKARHHGLGPLDLVSLAEARDRARAARKQLLDGIDPVAAKAAERAEAKAQAAAAMTFKQAAEAFIKAHKPGWKNAKHGDQWAATIRTYAEPTIGDLDVSLVETRHVLAILEPIWTTRSETASRLRGRIEAILSWCSVRGHRPAGDNPARWKGHLAHMLPAKGKVAKVRHHPAMPYLDVPSFLAELRRKDFISAKALEFCVLCAARTGEVIGAKWDEINIPSKVWVVPAERMKSGREHRIPLTSVLVELLEKLPKEHGNPHVFLGGRAGAGLSQMALLELLRGMRPDVGYTVHGFRSSFRDWVSEATAFPSELAEAALAHVVGDETVRAYRRTDALEKRRKMMTAWSDFLAIRLKRADNATNIRATAHV